MNWMRLIIGSVLAVQTLPPALAESSCDGNAELCEVASKASGRNEILPRPRRKPAPSVTTNSPEEIETPSAGSQMESETAATQAAACQTELRSAGAEFSVPGEVEASGECQVSDPVRLTSIATLLGPIELPGKPILRCTFALQFSTWVSSIAAPVVAGLSEAKLEAISTDPGFQCRNRNGDASGKISEHAFGNAIDIDGLVLSNGKRIEVSDTGIADYPHRPLLAALRTSACGYFTTVLGPGSNAAHESHFHFDLGKHGKNGDYRICE